MHIPLFVVLSLLWHRLQDEITSPARPAHVDGAGWCGESHRREGASVDFRFVHGKWWEDADVVYCNTLAFGETLLTALTALLCCMKP